MNIWGLFSRLWGHHKKYTRTDEDKFSEWAFGKDWENMCNMERMDEWNRRHAALFVLWPTDSIQCSLYDMRKEYKKVINDSR